MPAPALLLSLVGVLAQAKAPSTTPLPNPASEATKDLTDLSQACDPDASWLCQKVYEWTGWSWLAGLTEWLVAKPFKALVILGVAFVVNRIVRAVIKRVMQRRLDNEPSRLRTRLREKTPNVLLRTGESNLRAEARVQTLSAVFRSIASVIIWFTAIVMVLEVFEVNLGPLIATAGVIGVALGFGAQNMVRDFLAGFFLVVEDQFGVGDIVDLGPDAKGTVERVTLRATRVRDVNGVLWHVPNGQITRVGNKSQEWARALLDVQVAYDTDLDQAQDVIRRAAEALAADHAWASEILAAPEVWGVEDFAESGISIRVVLKTRPASQFGVLRELRARIKAAFDAAGLVMPPAGRSEVWVHDADRDADRSGPPAETG
ncbi:MAG: mechanosensitive ion channel family protein [Acidimicrobiales bacterium]